MRFPIVEQINAAMRFMGTRNRVLARALKVSEPRVSQMLKPGYNFTVETLEKIADALGMDLVVLFVPADATDKTGDHR